MWSSEAVQVFIDLCSEDYCLFEMNNPAGGETVLVSVQANRRALFSSSSIWSVLVLGAAALSLSCCDCVMLPWWFGPLAEEQCKSERFYIPFLTEPVSFDYPGPNLNSLLFIKHFIATHCTKIQCKDCHPVSVGLLDNTQTNTRV